MEFEDDYYNKSIYVLYFIIKEANLNFIDETLEVKLTVNGNNISVQTDLNAVIVYINQLNTSYLENYTIATSKEVQIVKEEKTVKIDVDFIENFLSVKVEFSKLILILKVFLKQI